MKLQEQSSKISIKLEIYKAEYDEDEKIIYKEECGKWLLGGELDN